MAVVVQWPHCPPTRRPRIPQGVAVRSEEHTSELQSQSNLVCRLLLEKKIEIFCSSRFNPVADALPLDGFERGYLNIIKATHNGRDRHSRSEILMCSLLRGLAFQKGLV